MTTEDVARAPEPVDTSPALGAAVDAALTALAATPRLLVACDFDGTISAITDDAASARPIDGAVAALDALAALPDTWAAVISGRALIDLTALAGMPERVHLVGSHGTEFEVGTIIAVSPTETDLLDMLVSQCRAIVADVDGAAIEVKPASVAVHVRRVADSSTADALLSAVRSGPGSLAGVHVLEGKRVVELAVFPGTKGDGVTALRERWSITGVMFIGDDVTDEHAFSALDNDDLGVKVGAGDSAATLRLADPAAVVRLLEHLASLRAAHVTEHVSVRD